ncbi:MAG: hypothetical protein ACRDVL_06665 [Acidimicrobiia bacterium]
MDHPLSDRILQVESDKAVIAVSEVGDAAVVDIHDPALTHPIGCPQLMTRNEEVLALSQCRSDQWKLVEVVSGDERNTPIPLEIREDGEYVWFTERGDTVVTGVGDAEGNLFELTTLEGIDLLGEGYASLTKLSVDGRHLAYVDHADPAAISHFWSPVVVVVDTGTGEEVGRWTLGNPVSCLEVAENWVLACEVDDPLSMEPEQRALVSIDLSTGEMRRVETRVRIFLPAG